MSCSGCPERWTGYALAHCAQCHATFTTVGNFDRHLHGPTRARGDRTPRGETRCHDPETVGLVLNQRGYWQAPGVEREWAAS